MKSSDPLQRLHEIRTHILGLKREAYAVIESLKADFESVAAEDGKPASAALVVRRGRKTGQKSAPPAVKAPRATRKPRAVKPAPASAAEPAAKLTAPAAPAAPVPPPAPEPAAVAEAPAAPVDPAPAPAPAPSAALPPPLPTQTPPPTPSHAMSYELKTNQNGQFHFNLKAGNGEVILSSQTYQDKASALVGIESVRTNGPVEANFERKDSSAGEPYFVLKAQNGQVIGTSQMYSSPAARDHGIASVQKNSPSTGLNDLTA